MAGTSLDMTVPRPGSLSQVYAVFGTLDPTATTIGEAVAQGATLRQVPVDLLIALHSGSVTLRAEALRQVERLDEQSYLGAAGFPSGHVTPAGPISS